jgi:hypothetical protein
MEKLTLYFIFVTIFFFYMKNVFFFCFCTLFLLACDKAEQVPSYIYIKPFVLNTDAATQGLNTQKITEAWVYADDELLGAFKLPAEVAILRSGNSKITLFAGVRDNGSIDKPNFYYHYAPYAVDKNLIAGKTDTIAPVVVYAKNLIFKWLEDFESPLNSLSTDADTDKTTNAVFVNTDVKYGKKCIALNVTKDHPLMSVTTKSTFEKLPNNRMYIEMDYKGDIPIIVELYGSSSSGLEFVEAATFKDKNEWNKAYINFSSKISAKFTSYNVIFTAVLPLDANGKPIKDAGEVRLDNLKLIHP